ncbi:IS5 family transposase [Streptomyces spongiae]|uniref:IS5 family transposase n=1 Tax=Streptomyces spongiae TaxID=565072 RepID=A0A5N8XNI0_9ACTN|nr:IS5 family transposase [Streptomyces spongiae]
MGADVIETLVPETLWKLFRRVVPSAPMRPQGGGRRRSGDREVLAAIIFVATTGCTWRQLPPVFGPSGPTAHRCFTEWSAARVWAKPHRLVLDELGARGELDWSLCAIDPVNMRALKGELAGPNTVDRGKCGSKIHLITERTGLPLSVGISGANLHDSQVLIPRARSAPWANPIEAHFGPLRQFTVANSNHRNHTAQTRALHAYLRRRNTNARHPDVLAAQRRERARIRSEKGIRWGRRPLRVAA